jgi:hypothetical protein
VESNWPEEKGSVAPVEVAERGVGELACVRVIAGGNSLRHLVRLL